MAIASVASVVGAISLLFGVLVYMKHRKRAAIASDNPQTRGGDYQSLRGMRPMELDFGHNYVQREGQLAEDEENAELAQDERPTENEIN